MTEFVTILVSAGSEDEARKIARELVEKRLAACVQTLPIVSLYRWEATIDEAREYLLLIKSRAADFADIEALVRAAHTYEVPEIICLPVLDGSRPYLAWLTASTAR